MIIRELYNCPSLLNEMKKSDKDKREILPLIPKDYMRGPVFASRKQDGPRELVIGDRKYEIGGFNPLDPERKPPAVDIRHGRACFTLLSFRSIIQANRTIRFSLNEFCRRYANSNGGRYTRDIRKILADLTECWFRVTFPDGTTESYRILERVIVGSKPIRRKDSTLAKTNQLEIWLDEVHVSEEFYTFLMRIAELAQIRIDVLNSIRSPLAQSIYTFLPSRAYHHTKNKPFEITLKNLLSQVGHTVPEHKSLRKQIFTQNNNPVISQLDNKETLSGVLRVSLVETADKTDFKILTWVESRYKEKKPLPKGSSKLIDAFLSGGKTQEELEKRLKLIEPLSDYETDLLNIGGIEVIGNEAFFQMAKALIGESRFDSILAESKGYALEGIAPTKNPTARLIFRLMDTVQNS